MDCLVAPVLTSLKRKRCSNSGYRPLEEDEKGGFGSSFGLDPVRVVVGREKREFWVDPFVLEEITPFRNLISGIRTSRSSTSSRSTTSSSSNSRSTSSSDSPIFVDVDSILFDHMLWLVRNDCSTLLQLNLNEIIDFYD